jgi:hypothetical protein
VVTTQAKAMKKTVDRVDNPESLSRIAGACSSLTYHNSHIMKWLFGLTILFLVSKATPALTGTTTTSGSVAYPLKVSSNNRYLVDQNNEPFLLVGDAAWNLLVKTSVNGPISAKTYFAV